MTKTIPMHGYRAKAVQPLQIMKLHLRDEESWLKRGKHCRRRNHGPLPRRGSLSPQQNRLSGLLHRLIPLDYMLLKSWTGFQHEAPQFQTGLLKGLQHVRVLRTDSIITVTITTSSPSICSALILSSEPRVTALH